LISELILFEGGDL